MKIKPIFLILVLSVLVACTADEPKSTPKTPNLIFILADDLGYGDLSSYGSHKIKTPNLDQMASEGCRFTEFYSGSAVCTPTRVSCMTGKYPYRYNVLRHFNDIEMHIPDTIQTLPKLLKKAGYVSKHVGKWHLGGLNLKHIQNREESIPGPLQHGFDHYLAMLEDPAYRKPAMLEDRLYKDAGKSLVRDEKQIPENNDHWTDIKVQESLDFIEEMNGKGQHFFLNLWFDAPHAPYEATPEVSMKPFEGKAKGKEQFYRAMVTHMDRGVGRILGKLKELGIEENTLIIFTSDNGPAYRGSAGMLKGRKTDFHEGGIRVPGIAWWPGQIAPGWETKQLGHTNDLLPTFCEVAGVELGKKVDGISLLPLLKDKRPLNDIRGTVFWNIAQYHGNFNIVTDKKPEPYSTEIARNGNWKLLAKEGKPLELFNLEEDPYERWNLINDFPEIAEKLTSELNDWLNNGMYEPFRASNE